MWKEADNTSPVKVNQTCDCCRLSCSSRVTSACFPAKGDYKPKEVHIVLLIYTAVNINTLTPAYNETECDGIFPVARMFLLV
jgi:hypothetical protein